MNSHSYGKARAFLILVIIAILAMTAVAIGAAPDETAGEGAGPDAQAMAKIHSKLLSEMKSVDATDKVQFVARVKAGADLSAYTEQWFSRPFVEPLGTTAAAGFATKSAVFDMAADADVIYLRPGTSVMEVPQLEDEDLQRADISPQINTDPDASPGPAPEGWYSTTGAIHGSQDAWDKGYTGDGVRYMSNDSGADYCHPDLHGTWAYVDDSGSPYYGLPMMFDSYSSYQTAFDYYVGASRIANGLSDYADTSATAAGDFVYKPLGADVMHNYIVPVTSLSGVYHYGSHPDNALADVADILSGGFGHGTAVRGERAAVLVVDENTAGVYDTVYVDLNYDFDFSNDIPARLTRDFSYQEAACLDYDFDGLNDVSGGLVYYISDGVSGVPTHDWFWFIPTNFYGNGDLVAFHVMDYTQGGGDHGMGTTSTAIGQGVVQGSVYWGPGGSPIADYQGLVVGPGKDALSTQNGDNYLSPFWEDGTIFAVFGYDGYSNSGDEVQIISNSYGFSGTDNDGWDFDSRNIDRINRTYGPHTTQLFSTGNGAAGYGTTAPPSPSSAISVGASTLFGSIGVFEPIASADQILGGDVISWSNRGPGARSITGVDVVATGAFGTGDLPLNQTLWGAIATADFGGTSMSAPVAAGNLALLYQAWYERTGEWPTFDEAEVLLMGSAKNTDHDIWSQGGGLVDADEGTDVAGGHGGFVAAPPSWSVGDYRGDEFGGFANIIGPGERDDQTFTLYNYGDKKLRVTLDTLTMKLINTRDYSFTSLDQSMDHGSFTTPDYAFRIDQDIPNSTDLLMVRLTKPYEQFDPDQDYYPPYNNWRVHLQNWTDLNNDGQFWIDSNNNGKVDIGEMEEYEYIRFTYGYNYGPTQQARMSNPLDRIDDGLLLTFRHRDEVDGVDTTDLTVEASFYKFTNWSWVQTNKKKINVPAGGSATFNARIKVPPNTPIGMYEGALVATAGDSEVVIPVTVAVAASGTSFTFGDTNYKNGQTPLYDNERVFGYTDYNWRAESGDWRFFWTDIAEGDLPDTGTSYLVMDNAWVSPGTDIDSIVMGPTPDGFTPDPFYGPYTLDQVGRSVNTYIGSGRWIFQTSSGGPREIISAPIQEGLHGLFLHQVRVDGSFLSEPFYGDVGLANLDPSLVVGSGSGSADVTISSELAMNNFVGDGFGLGAPVTTTEIVAQDDPDDSSTASFVTTIDVDHGALIEVSTCCTTSPSDIDLFVLDSGGNVIASSTTSSDVEFVSVLFPSDGTYTIAVHGYSVPGGTDTFDLTVNLVQGYGVTLTNLPAAVPAGGSETFTINWDTTGLAPGTYYGLVLFGPAAAPGLFQIPLEITVP